MHNSLVLSNNSKGFNHFFIEYFNDKITKNNYIFKIRYMVTKNFKNRFNQDFFLSAWYLIFKTKIAEIGITRNILNGGIDGIRWNQNDAFLVFNLK